MVIGGAPAWHPTETEGWSGPGLWMALGVHALLLLALAFSVNWKTSDSSPVEAEVWSEIPRVAGGATPPTPPRVVEEVPREKPIIRPEPVKAADPEPEPQRPPDLVVDKTPPKKPAAKPQPQKLETKPDPVKKPEPKKPDPKKADTPKPEKPTKVDKPVDKPVRSSSVTDPSSRSLSAAELEAQRKANLQRMMSSLGGGAAGSQAVARTSGPSEGYAGRIVARVKPNLKFPDHVSGNPHAIVEVRCTPDGRIIARRLIAPSGMPAWDDAVLRALDRTEVLPTDVDGTVPSLLQLSFKLRDF